MEKNYSNLIVESANKLMDEAMDITKKDIVASNKQLKASAVGTKAANALQKANKGKGTFSPKPSSLPSSQKPANVLQKATGAAKRGIGSVQNKVGKMSTGQKIGAVAAGVGLAGLAAWKIKKERCKKNCASSTNPKECMAKC